MKAILLGAVTLGLAVACAPTNPGMVAEGVIAPDMMCLVTATNPLLAEGTLDLGGDPAIRPNGITYSIAFRVANQLINNSNRVYPLMSDPDIIVVDHVEVTLLDTSENVLSLGGPNPYLVPADGTIASTESMDPSFGIAAATVIPDSYGQLLASMGSTGTILVRARIIGTTAGGAVMTSGPVVFPIHLCMGCLFACVRDVMTGASIETRSCLVGQDGVSHHC